MHWSLAKGSGELFRSVIGMREYDISGVNAGADDHQPPDPFAGGVHGGHEAVHRALFRVGGAASHKIDRTAMGILMEYVG